MTDDARRGSLWLATTGQTSYPRLEAGQHVDVAVVGGGITGLTAAMELLEAGEQVAVLEAGRIVEGTTGHTTAKLTSQHGLCYADLLTTFGRESARQYARANEAAIDAVEERVGELGVECDFERRPAYVYANSREEVPQLREEARSAMELGLPATYEESVDAPVSAAGAVRFDEQAQFHPRAYLLALAEAIDDHERGAIYEGTRALDVDRGEPCRVATTRGDVAATDVVVASHFPFYDRAGYFARLHPRRAYLLAVRVRGEPPRGMYYRVGDGSRTFRTAPVRPATLPDDVAASLDLDAAEELLVVGGETHRPGDGASPARRYERCEAFAREHFDVRSVAYRWSTHDQWSVDGVPFVGRAGPGVEHVFVGTGFGGWGMTGGTAAGIVLAALVADGEHPHADVFDPLRVTPWASARELVSSAARNAAQLAGERLRAALADAEGLRPGDATVVTDAGQPVGVYRDEDGEFHAVSASCTHMHCVLEFNDAEATWDCPCHGSRFTVDGEVVSGPALEGLEHLDL